MTTKDQQLDPAILWDDDGCLSEIGINALADGELEAVPDAALHAEDCQYCTDKLGHAALFSLEIASAFEHMPPVLHAQPVLAAQRRPFPVGALALAVGVAFIAILPSLPDLTAHVVSLPNTAARILPVLAQLIARIGQGASQLGGMRELGWPAALLLSAFGAAVARFAPQRQLSRQLTQQGAP
jgi:hypothetical protein